LATGSEKYGRQAIPASFEKTVTVGSVSVRMQVISSRAVWRERQIASAQRVQDMLAHKARGADVVFDQFYPEDLKGRC